MIATPSTFATSLTGSHGAGDPSETETPVIVWGSGVAPPRPAWQVKGRVVYDRRVQDWGLGHLRRHDLYQADITPLAASILTIPIPVNSVVSSDFTFP